MRATAPDVAALVRGYRQVTCAVSRLSSRDFLRPTLTEGWCISDLLFHLLLDTQRALVTFATPRTAVPDVDAVTYWRLRSGADGAEHAAHARYVRLSAAAYRSPAGLVQQWTAPPRLRCGRRTRPIRLAPSPPRVMSS